MILFEVMQSLAKLQRLDKSALMNTVFLLKQDKLIPESAYAFYPFTEGPFSSKIESDLKYFERIGWITQEETAIQISKSEKAEKAESAENAENTEKTQKRLSVQALKKIKQVSAEFPTSMELLEYVAQNYPEYCTKREVKAEKRAQSGNKEAGYFLIGYEGRDIDEFLNTLIRHEIQSVIDVRNNPRSMKFEFNKDRLETTLQRINITYYHRPELGIPRDQRKNMKDRQEYEKLFREYKRSLQSRKKFLDELIGLGLTQRIAIMCFERDPQMCHRREIGKYLEQEGYQVQLL